MKIKKNGIDKLLPLLIFLSLILLNINQTHSNIDLNNTKPETHDNFSNIGLNSDLYNKSALSYYFLDVYIEEDPAIIKGNITINFFNHYSEAFSRIPFHLYIFGMQYVNQPGSITILKISDKVSQTNLTYNVLEEEHLMWVNLLELVETQQWANFTIFFNAILPDGGIDRSNVHGSDAEQSRILKCAVFYPMLCVYDQKDGWNTDPYLSIGDPFYSAMAFHNLRINIPKEMIIAATGNMTGKKYLNERTIYTFDPVHPVRELTFALSRYFIQESIIYENINISTFYLPQSSTNWEEHALEITQGTFHLFSEIGTYPYPTFNVVEEFTSYGGMEHPCQVYISSRYGSDPLYQEYLDIVIAHESAHQWYYQLVGNDEVDCGHLDEGLVVWMTDWFLNSTDTNYDHFDDYDLIESVRNHVHNSEIPPEKINQSALQYEYSDNYWYNAYTKTPALLEKLRKIIGHDAFISGLQLLFSQFQFKIAWFSDLQDVLEESASQSLDWFFKPWFENAYLPKYEILNPSWDKQSQELSFEITDINADRHNYVYSQQLLFRYYNENGLLIKEEEKWINQSTQLVELNITEKPINIGIKCNHDYIMETPRENINEIQHELFSSQKSISLPISLYGISLTLGVMIIIVQTQFFKKTSNIKV